MATFDVDAPEPGVMDVKQVAAVLHCHPDTVNAEIKRGRLKAARVGRLLRVTARQLAEYLEGEAS